MRPSIGLVTLFLMGPGAAPALAGAPAPQAAAGPEAGQGLWIVSPRSYWRYHYTFRPAQSYLPKEGKLSFLPTRYGALNTGPTGNRLATPEPPAGWMLPDFDDSGWPVNRAPLPWMPEMDQDGAGPYSCHVIRKACGRTRFLVPDPARVGRLALELQYHGGVIVYVNGREVGRANIPKDGALAAEGFAEPFPEEAYRPTDPDRTAKARQLGVLDGNYPLWGMALPYHRWRFEGKPEAQAAIDQLAAVRTRSLKLEVPKPALRAGANVLAIENRVSPVLECVTDRSGKVHPSLYFWKIPHLGITDIALAGDPPGAVASADLRPAGVQAWARDIHQWTLEEDFLEPGVPQSRVVRLAVARNGACSGQVVIGTSQELAGPAATMSELAGPGGAKLPAAAVSVRWARSVALKQVKTMHRVSFFNYMADRWLIRYRGAPADTWVAEWTDHSGEGALLGKLWAKDTMQIFDQLGARPPEKLPAGRSQPVWVTAEVPRDAAPGLYAGTLTLKAGGLDETRFEVRLQVFDFALPAAKDFTAYAGIDESPWALAKWHNLKLWSDEHWQRIEQSVQWAGKLGARVAGIPVIHQTELNNENDAMIKWVKQADGAYGFDFSLADRYLDLWRKYCHRQPDIIVYLVLPANEYGKYGGTGSVTLLDPATGGERAFAPPKAEGPEGQKLWVDCARAIRAHFNSKGIQDANLHWGLFFDYIGAAGYALAEPLAKELPGVGWARSSHEGRKIGGGHQVKVTWNAAVRAEQKPPFTRDGQVTALKGWSDPGARLLLPRADSDVNALSILPPLWQMREVAEMPVTSAYRGFARICVDGWGRGAYFGPFNPWLTYPAAGGGVDGSIQLEVLREGLQETEARVFLEKREALAPEAKQVLDLRTERVWMIPPRPEGQRISEYWAGWQELSWDLYAAAAAASGGKAPGAQDQARFFAAPAAGP